MTRLAGSAVPRRRIELVDASILIDVVDVPGEAIDRAKVLTDLDAKRDDGVLLILPISAVIETAQHVQRIRNGHERRRCALTFEARVRETLEQQLPWTFVPQTWDSAFVSDWLSQTPPSIANLAESLASHTAEAGDLLLVSEYRRLRQSYPRSRFHLSVWSHDDGLRTTVEGLD